MYTSLLLQIVVLFGLLGTVAAQPVVFINARIHPASGPVIPNGILVMDKGRIVAVGDSVQQPESALVIDCQGKHLYPGFIAPATTLGLTEIDAVRSTNDVSEIGSVNPNARAEAAYNPDSEIIPTIRSNGVLLANVTPTGGLISGMSSIMRLDGWTREDIAVTPRSALIVNWPSMRVVKAWWMTKSSEEQKKEINESLETINTVFREARAYWLAAKNNVDTTKRDIRYEAMRRVFDGTMPVIINAGSQRQIEAALDFATEFSIKVIIAGGYDAPLVADRLVKMHVPVIVQRVHSLPQRDDSGYDEAFTIAARLHAAGVKFCLSDGGSWQQRNLPFQAGTAIAYGLEPDAALASITLAPAQIFGIDADYGSLEAGKSATLFLSSGDALDGVSIGVERAWIDGREIDLSNRHKRLSTKYRGRYSR